MIHKKAMINPLKTKSKILGGGPPAAVAGTDNQASV